MTRYFLMVALLVGGFSVYGQQTAATKTSCAVTQCQARKATTTSTSTAATATAVVATTNTAPDRAVAPAVPACSAKSVALPISLDLQALIEKNCDPSNCEPKNCDPSACQPGARSATTATTLAVKQE